MNSANAQWSAGFIGLGQSNPYIAGDAGVRVFPAIAYQGEKFVWRGPFIDYFLVGSQRSDSSFSVNLGLAPNNFEAEGDPRLTGINDRDSSFMAGVSVNTNVWGGRLTTRLQSELSDQHNGQRMTLGWQTKIARSKQFKWAISGGVELEYLSADFANYYYGVSPGEAAVSDFNSYRVGEVIQPQITIQGFYSFTAKWRFIGNIGFQRLDNSIVTSPLVDGDTQYNIFTGLTYSF
jgi:outer membrane protein